MFQMECPLNHPLCGRLTQTCSQFLSTSTAFALAQVTLSIHLNDSEVDEFQKMIPIQLALPPWNYSQALQKGIEVYYFVTCVRHLDMNYIRCDTICEYLICAQNLSLIHI